MRSAVVWHKPLQWGHRLSAMETGLSRVPKTQRREPFNGATAFRRWKLDELLATASLENILQWGHRLSAMETRRYPQTQHDDVEPSMGPPPFGDGNRYWLLNSAFSPWKFVIVAALVFTARNRSAPVQLKPSRS